MIRFTITPSNFRFNEKAIQQLDFPKLAHELLQGTKLGILKGLQQGQGPNGPLKPYSRSYIEAIDAGIIAGKSPGEHTPTLRASGQMLTGMQSKETQKGAQLYFQGSRSTRSARRKNRVSVSNGKVKRARANIKASSKPHSSGGGGRIGNAELAAAQEARGREFFGYAEPEIKRIESAISNALDVVMQKLVS